MKKILLWIVGILVALVAVGAIFGGGDKKPAEQTSGAADKPAEATKAEAAKPAALSVTANDLVKAYKENEIAANEKFKGKSLLVSGSIESIDAGVTDKPTIILKSSSDFGMNNPMANLADSDIKKAATLKKGQAIKMLCVGDSEMGGTPMLDECVIQ